MANIHWKNGVSGDWNTGSDWVGGVPGASDTVTIAAAGNYTVTVDHSEAAQSITLNAAGATLAESGQHVTLTLGTGLTVTAGTLSLIASLGAPDIGFSSTQVIQGGFVDVSSGGVLSMTLPSGAGSSEYSTNITSSVDLEGTSNVGTHTELVLLGGGVLGGTFAGLGKIYLHGAYLANGASFAGLGGIEVDGGGFYVTTNSGSFTNFAAQDSSTLSVASGLTATVSGELDIGQPPTSLFPEASFANVIGGPGTLVTTGAAYVNDNSQNTTELTVGGGLTWINGGELNIDGAVAVNQSRGDSFTLINQASGTVLFEQPGGITLGNTGTDLFTNAGALDASGVVTLAIPINDTGTIDPGGSLTMLTLSGGGTLGGVLDDNGTLVLDGQYALAAGGLAGDPVLGNGNLALNDGVLDVGASSTFAGAFGTDGGNDELVISAGADLTLSGAVTIGQVAAQNPNLYIIGPGTLTTLGTTTLDDSGSGVSLIGQGTWINGGSLIDDARIDLGDTTSASDVETIVNQAGATFDVEGPDGGILINGAGSGLFDNLGTLVRGGDSGTSTIAACLSNSGTIDVTSGTLALTGGGTITGELDGSGTLLLSAGHYVVASPLFGNGHLVVGAGATVTSVTVLDGGGTLTIPAGHTMSYTGSLAIGDASGGYTISGPGTLSTQGTTSIFDGGAGALTFVANGGVTWINSGTVNDAGFGYVAYGGGAGNANVTNSGTFNLTTDDASLTVYDGSTTDTFTNTGTLAKTAGTGISTIGLTLNDTGTIAVATGTLALVGGGLVAGALSGGGLLDMSYGTYTSTGLGGAGHLAITGGAMLTETATGTIATSVLVGGNASLFASPKASTLTLSGPVTVGDANGYGVFSGLGTIATTSVTTILDRGAGALAFVGNGGVTWTNSGTVNDGGFGYAAYGGGAGSANVTNSGTFNLTSDDASLTIYDSSTTDTFTNTGMLAKTAGTGTSQIGLAIKDTGSIAVASGTLALIGGGLVSGVLSGGGLLDLFYGTFTSTGIAGAGHLAITGGATLTETSTGTIATSVAVGGNASLLASPKTDNLTLSGAVTLGDANGYGVFSGPGTIVTSGATTIFDGGAGALTFVGNGGGTWANSGTVNDGGFGYVAYGGGAGSAAIVNSGTFDFTSDDANLTIYDSSTTDTFTNTGTLAKTAGTGTSQIGLAIKDTGTIAVASGTLALSGGGLVSGALSGGGLLDLYAGIFTSTGISGAGHLAITGGAALTETATGTFATSVAIGGNAALLASPKATVLTLSGAVTLGDANGYGALSGPGTITTTGITTIFDGGNGVLDFVANGTLSWMNSGTVNDGGFGYFAYGGGAGGATIVNSGTFNLTSDDASLTIYDSSSSNAFTNTGLLAKTGGTGVSQISVAISNAGTIEAAHGTLQLTGALSGTGSLKIDAGATLDVAGTLPASQKVSFNGGAAATLKLETPASIGTLTNFTAGDRLDLTGVGVTNTKITGNTLSVVTSAGTYTYVSSGIANEVATSASDGAGGTFVSLYRGAIPTHTPEPLAFGNFHVGSTTGTTAALTVTNAASADGYSEKLNAGFGGASAGFSAMGTVTGIVAGASNATSLTAAIDTGTAGAKSGTATLTLASNGAGIDGRGTTPLASQVVNLTGAVYNYAAATLAGGTINLGVIHAGTAAGAALGLTNSAAAGGYSEGLDAGLSGASAGLSTSGSISLLAAGMSDGTSLMLTVDTGNSGAYSGTAVLGLISDGAGTSGLGTTTLTSQTVTVTATVDNYALAALEDPGGPALSGTSTNATLNLGSVAQGGAALQASIGALNAAGGLSDLLGGTFTTAGGAGFTNTGFGTFTGLSAGQEEHAQSISLATGAAGTFTETILLSSYGTNASGYYGALTTETLTIIGTVTASTFSTYTLANGPNVIHGADGLGDVFIATAASINSGDQLTGGKGSNSMTLVGAGKFDLNAPSVLANIPAIQGVEGQAGTGGKTGKPDTRQTILLRNATSETLTIAAGTAATGNKNPEAVTVTAGTGTYAITLAGGADQVTLGTGLANVTLGGTANSIAGGGGTGLIHATAAFAGAKVVGASTGQTTLEVTTGGNVTLNAADTHLTVQLDAASNLKLSTLAFINAIGSSGADTLTALGGTQTLTGGAGIDTLVGYSGGNDIFADTAAGLNGDTIKGWTTGDMIDLKDISAASLHALTFSGNTLKVSDGTTTAAIKFAAGSSLSNFVVLGSDGGAGVLIGYHV